MDFDYDGGYLNDESSSDDNEMEEDEDNEALRKFQSELAQEELEELQNREDRFREKSFINSLVGSGRKNVNIKRFEDEDIDFDSDSDSDNNNNNNNNFNNTNHNNKNINSSSNDSNSANRRSENNVNKADFKINTNNSTNSNKNNINDTASTSSGSKTVHFSESNINETQNKKTALGDLEESQVADADLFYDPTIDERNETWIGDQRKQAQPRVRKTTSQLQSNGRQQNDQDDTPQYMPAQGTDAVLNCPLCICLISLDCQRHASYKTQYRAMFVYNCKIMKEEVLHYAPKVKKQKRPGKGNLAQNQTGMADYVADAKLSAEASASNNRELKVDEYHPVRCELCNSEIGVYDWDEIYHFFNVLASQS